VSVKHNKHGDEVARSRYRELVLARIAQLGGDVHGVRSRVCREFGINLSHLGRVLTNRSGIGMARLAYAEAFMSGRAVPADGAPVADAEIDAMRALAALDDATRVRVLAWASGRWRALLEAALVPS
jgi:hypothetical protein